MNWKCVQFRNKVLVNCERRPGSASVDQFDRLRDRSNTHVLFSESSLAQCGVEQFTTTSPRQKAEVLCTRTEFLIDSALTVPLWSWKVTVHCSLCSSHLTTSETVLQKNSGGCVFCEEPNVFGKYSLVENPDTLFPFWVRK